MDGYGVTVTIKGGPGFEVPWLVINAENMDEAEAAVDAVTDSLLEKVSGLSQGFRAACNAGPVINSGAGAEPTQPVTAQAKAASRWGAGGGATQSQPQATQGPGSETLHPEGKTCVVCGSNLKLVTGTNSRGEWSAWRCVNAPRGKSEHTMDFN